jgi:hypothetical protein
MVECYFGGVIAKLQAWPLTLNLQSGLTPILTLLCNLTPSPTNPILTMYCARNRGAVETELENEI